MQILAYNKTAGYNVNVAHRHEKGFKEQYSVFDLDTNTEVLTARIYEKGAGTCCVVWASVSKTQFNTTGSAYKKWGSNVKPMVAALESAGFQFAENYRDVRDSDLVIEAAKVMGYTNVHVFNAHP